MTAAFVAGVSGNNNLAVTTNAVSMVMPSPAAVGNTAILIVSENSGSPTFTAPSGWTVLSGPDDNANLNMRTQIWAKDLVSSDLGKTITVTCSVTARPIGYLGVYSGTSASQILHSFGQVSTATTTLTNPTFNVTANNTALVFFYVMRDNAAAPAASLTLGSNQVLEANTVTNFTTAPNFTIVAEHRNAAVAPGTAGGSTATANASVTANIYSLGLPPVTVTSLPAGIKHFIVKAGAEVPITLDIVTSSAPARPGMTGFALPGGFVQSSQANCDKLLNAATAMGVKWIRTDCNWSWIEGTQGSPNWAWMDYIRDGCKSRGLSMVWILGTMPAWARPAGQPETYGPTSTTEQTNFANFATQVVTRYKADVHYWEVWNEANLDQFWTPTPSASSYAGLLQKTYNAIKAADSTATVLSTATGGAGSSPDIASTTWWTNLYAAGARPYFDIAAHHPYIDTSQVPSGVYNTGEMANAATIRNTMNSNGDTAKQLWATEMGMPTSGTSSVTETQQTTATASLRDLWFSREANSKIFFYTAYDDAVYGATGTTREDFFGFIKSDGTHKPVFADEQTWVAAG